MRRVRFFVNVGPNLGWFGRALAVFVALFVLGAFLVFIGAWLVLALAALAVAAIGSIVVLALRGGPPSRLPGRGETTVVEAELATRHPNRDQP